MGIKSYRDRQKPWGWGFRHHGGGASDTIEWGFRYHGGGDHHEGGATRASVLTGK